MYLHPRTREGQFPRTARELLHSSLGLLVEQFPDRVIDRRRPDDGRVMSVSAYSWPGAGSEKGGSAEHMGYERVVFLPEREGRVSVVSVGDKQFDFMRTVFILDDREGSPSEGRLFEYDISSGRAPAYYSVLFRYSVSPKFADALLGHYHSHIKGQPERDYDFVLSFEDVLEDGTRHFIGCPLFAVDPSDRSLDEGRVYANRYGSLYDGFTEGSLVEVPVFWRDSLRGEIAARERLSHSLAQYLQGEAVDPSFSDSHFQSAFDGWSHRYLERTFQSNAYDPQGEEKGLARLAKSLS